MEKELTPEEKAEQELADKIKPLIEERIGMDMNRQNGITLEKDQYIGARTKEIEEELSRLKSEKTDTENNKPA